MKRRCMMLLNVDNAVEMKPNESMDCIQMNKLMTLKKNMLIMAL
jgi:hypothetical protein